MSDNATLRRLLREHAEAVSTEIAIIKEDAILRLFDAVQNEYAAQVAALQTALRDIYEACYAADCDGELDSRIDGDILDAARLALKGGEK